MSFRKGKCPENEVEDELKILMQQVLFKLMKFSNDCRKQVAIAFATLRDGLRILRQFFNQ